ncbi:Muscle M-line assembly protein unc-89 [Holothuria leucospilota]|uniref:Muscle M-line assembly protein unc-89 n=1 Tax=Holothuria leucospilota TaxID=206669 RepID=A0A9Q1CMM6_HOLLE|nr:Muscle M-line assembly protein unc-89 [Holothuria leucospilota]
MGYFSGPLLFLWFVNDDLMKEGVGYGRETDVEYVTEMCSNITYQSQRWYNGKTLTCLVSNENNLNVSKTLHVLYGPSVVILNTSWPTFMSEGDNVSIHCNTEGNPSPEVNLQRKTHGQDWETLQMKPISLYSTNTVTRWWFVISDIHSSMMGHYRCIAFNDFGLVETKSEVLLNVYGM